LQKLNTKNNPKICVITTIDASLDGLFPGFYPLLISKGYDVVGICADTSDGLRSENVRKQGVRVINVPMTREFTIWQDIKCLWALCRIFKKERFDIIHYSTPKASLLAAIAGHIAGASLLLYTLRGLGYSAVNGTKRFMSRWCEKIACLAADRVIAISKSLATEAVREKLLPKNRIEVLGSGSSKGVNLEEFNLNEITRTEAKKIRQKLNITDNTIVIGYAGRLTEEKGINELLEAFRFLCHEYVDLFLLLIGDQDARNPLKEKTVELIEKNKRICITGRMNSIPGYLAAVDIFVLPSYREGFGNVIIEASAMQRPVIATDIPGCRDGLVDGDTGYLVKPYDANSLYQSLKKLVCDPSERIRLGLNGEKWVTKHFDRKIVWARLISVYEQMLDLKKNKKYNSYNIDI